MLPGKKTLVAPSAVVQARQRLGVDAVKEVYHQSQKMWHKQAEHPQWCGLTILGVDGVVWRTPDTDENRETFKSPSNHHGDCAYPQVRMVYQMELTSHLLVASAFDSYKTNEMKLAEQLTNGDYKNFRSDLSEDIFLIMLGNLGSIFNIDNLFWLYCIVVWKV